MAGRRGSTNAERVELIAGSAAIGSVSVTSISAGDNNIGNVDIASAIPAGEAHLGEVGGKTIVVAVEKTRPADTTAYAADDAINESASAGTLWSFVVGRIATGTGVIVAALLQTDQAANVSAYELDLYTDTITVVNDNAEATRLYANAAKWLGTISFAAAAKQTANSNLAEGVGTFGGAVPSLPFKCVGSSTIYGVLRTVTGFTPASAQKFTVTLAALAD